MRQFLLFLLITFQLNAQKFVNLSDQLSNITHGITINGNDFSVTEQVIINANEINFKKPAYLVFYNVLININGSIKGKGKFNLLNGAMVYIKNRDTNSSVSKLHSKKPFGEEFPLKKCKLFKNEKKGTPFTLWHTNGKKYATGMVGDDTVVKRMFYNIRLGKKYLDKQIFTD